MLKSVASGGQRLNSYSRNASQVGSLMARLGADTYACTQSTRFFSHASTRSHTVASLINGLLCQPTIKDVSRLHVRGLTTSPDADNNSIDEQREEHHKTRPEKTPFGSRGKIRIKGHTKRGKWQTVSVLQFREDDEHALGRRMFLLLRNSETDALGPKPVFYKSSIGDKQRKAKFNIFCSINGTPKRNHAYTFDVTERVDAYGRVFWREVRHDPHRTKGWKTIMAGLESETRTLPRAESEKFWGMMMPAWDEKRRRDILEKIERREA